MFKKLFGGAKEKPSSAAPSIKPSDLESINNQIELTEKRISVLEQKAQQELAKAKQFHAQKNTKGALMCMKRKKMYEEHLDFLNNTVQNLETTKFTLENQNTNLGVMKAHTDAKNLLKAANKKVDPDKVEDTMYALTEEMDKIKQTSEALQQPLGGVPVDEDELLQELDMELAMEEATVSEDIHLPEMPQIPSSSLPAKKQRTKEEEEDEALRALEAELAM